jgi:hypothetical protein
MSRVPDTHAEAWDLLPWLANGRLAPAEREWVEAHVHGCGDCRAELAAQRQVATQMHSGAAPTVSASDEQRSFDKLWSRIEASEGADVADATRHTDPPARRGSTLVRWLAAAVIVQGFGLALLGFNSLRTPATDSRYVTVSNVDAPRADAPTVRIVFTPEASMGAITTLLSHQGLTLVAGPGTSGNFTAALSADAVASGASAQSVADVISKDPNVSFAQPVAR